MTPLKHSYTTKCGPLKNVAFKVLTDVFLLNVVWWSDIDGEATSKSYVRQNCAWAQNRTKKGRT